jgi:anthranilate synthase component 2
MKLLLIDNYDSFTYNLAQAFGSLGAEVNVIRNDKITVDDLQQMEIDRIVISPGPGTPDDSGVSLDTLIQVSSNIPTLGVCLGHQCIGQAFGGSVVRADNLMHGKVSDVHHKGAALFTGVPNPFIATRYHSLIVKEPIPADLSVIAFTGSGEVMGLKHKSLPIVGVQFHPESILTEYGPRIMQNFLEGRF